jgi:hypothetical protein
MSEGRQTQMAQLHGCIHQKDKLSACVSMCWLTAWSWIAWKCTSPAPQHHGGWVQPTCGWAYLKAHLCVLNILLVILVVLVRLVLLLAILCLPASAFEVSMSTHLWRSGRSCDTAARL